MRRLIFVVSGPSGVGKTSIVNELLKVRRNIAQVISYTTREIRNNEINGIHYNFISNDKFQELYDNGDFLESAEIFGNRYGVSRTAIKQILDANKHALLVINWKGYIKLKEEFGDRVIGIFLSPPSFDTLRKRIEHRSTDTREVIEKRLSMAVEDMDHRHIYNYDLINDNIPDTVFKLARILDLAE